MNQMLGRGIRTLAEVRDGRVTVTITVDTQESTREEIEDLNKALTLTTTSREFNRAKVLEQRAEIEELRAELDTMRANAELKDRLETEQAERVANREWAERAEDRVADLETMLADRDRTLNAIRDVISREEVAGSIVFGTGPREQAFRDIRELLSSSPSTGTSQA